MRTVLSDPRPWEWHLETMKSKRLLVSVVDDNESNPFQTCCEDQKILVPVSDTGIGLPPQLAEQIFDPFFTTKPHGTGMGLRISRSIIESHSGRLWAVGSPGRGATFHLNLPAAIPAQR
jgi:signal transduction histidine kinase